MDPLTPLDGCPKRMTHGPCGGVGADHACEVPGVACPFPAADALPTWSGPAADPRPAQLPTLLIDVRSDPADARSLDAAARMLREVGAAALLGEHLDDPVPGSRAPAEVLVGHGVPVVATLTPRDRTPEECEAEVEALIDTGVTAVHCVTGDHPAARFDPRSTARFGLDSTRLTAMAHAAGATVSVAESPAAPPVDWRADRVRSKERAGAGLAVLNHAGSVDDLHAFADRCRIAGVTIPLVAPVPVVTDHRSASALTRFPGVTLPPGLLDGVLSARDPRTEGIERAVAVGRELLAGGRFRHLNLSGSASAQDRNAVMAAVAGRLDP